MASALKRFWAWIVGLFVALFGVVGVVTVLEKRKAKKATKALAQKNVLQAKELAQVKLDAAVTRGIERVQGADSAAEEIVDDSGGTLGQYLTERDPGPTDD